MSLFKVSYKTIYNWLDRWESEGMVGLYNKPGRGRKRTFNEAQEKSIREWAKQEPRQLKQVRQKIKETWGIDTSTETIKKDLENLFDELASDAAGSGWRANPLEYEDKQAQLEGFKRLEDEGKINLYYLDETGFSLIPSVPYGWQDKGST